MSLKDLDVEHLESFRRALFNVLSTPIAEFTFAQIVDGQPTRSVYAHDHFFRDGLPVMQHKNLCHGSLEKTRAFRSDLDILALKFEPRASNAPFDNVRLQANIEQADCPSVPNHSTRYYRMEATTT